MNGLVGGPLLVGGLRPGPSAPALKSGLEVGAGVPAVREGGKGPDSGMTVRLPFGRSAVGHSDEF